MKTMRAMTINEPGARFTLVEHELPVPGPHEVRIAVRACGICHSDAIVVEGQMPGLSYPRVPGHEVIGTIDALGPDVEGWSEGALVGVGWHRGSCGHCQRCRRGDAFACENMAGATGLS